MRSSSSRSAAKPAVRGAATGTPASVSSLSTSAVDQVASAAAIRALGVKVIGNLDALSGATPYEEAIAPIPPLGDASANAIGSTSLQVSKEVATHAVMGMLFASGAVRDDGSGEARIDVRVEPQGLRRVHTLDLLRIVAQRLLWSLTSRLRKIVRR